MRVYETCRKYRTDCLCRRDLTIVGTTGRVILIRGYNMVDVVNTYKHVESAKRAVRRLRSR